VKSHSTVSHAVALTENDLDIYLGELDLTGLLATTATVIFEHERNFIAFVQCANTSAFQSGRVNEHVLATIVWLDKSKAFCAVEELDDACNAAHAKTFPKLRGDLARTLRPHA
jgi:hypothetical protein